jgi:uncharacterized protein UPF0547
MGRSMFVSPAFAQGPTSSADAPFGWIVLAAIVIILVVWQRVGEARRQSELADQHGIIIKRYTGNQAVAMGRFQADASTMAARGYFPTSQIWAPGQWGAGAFIIALLLCLVLIGLIALIYMLIVKPDGTLTVTYERRTVAEEKSCPQCAERVKTAALVCRFCGHKFPALEPQMNGVSAEEDRLIPKVMEQYRGYTYASDDDGRVELKLSSGRWKEFPSLDELRAFVDDRMGEKSARSGALRRDFVDARKEINEASMAVLREARDQGYRITLANEAMVAAQRSGDRPIYFTSNWDIQDWGKANGWIDDAVERRGAEGRD